MTTDDAAIVDDVIRMIPRVRLYEQASTNDSITTFAMMTTTDAATIDDLATPLGRIIVETRNENESTEDGASYFITPDPYGGVGPLLVVDGGANDFDGTDDGFVTVRGVPIGMYMVNVTAPLGGFSPLLNFTDVTVHETDINADALFRLHITPVVASAPRMESDIVDVANNGFDNLTAAVSLAKVRQGTPEIITKTTDLPAPKFVGALNATEIQNATASQYTLLYPSTLGLLPHATPQEIVDAFRLSTYDSGNSNNTAFVGILTVTTESPVFGQYVATQRPQLHLHTG